MSAVKEQHRLGLYLPLALYREIQVWAALENRSSNAEIITMIQEAIQARKTAQCLQRTTENN